MQKCPSGNLGDVSLDVLLSATDLIYNNRFSASESQNGLIFNTKFANINFPRVRNANNAARRNLDISHQQNYSFSFSRRYFQGNGETCRTEKIQKRGIVLHDNENIILLLSFDGKI